MSLVVRVLFFFFFNDTATTEIYTLSLHDALPISLFWPAASKEIFRGKSPAGVEAKSSKAALNSGFPSGPRRRSEEHTSELQSHSDLVCRLLLEKKNMQIRN